jgi:hypothetical protein
MSKRVRVKPGKGQSMAGFVGGLIFCFLGLFFVVPIFGPFGFIWTLFAVIMTIINGYNAFSDKGVATHEITIEDDVTFGNPAGEKTAEERLQELKQLYEKGMITDEEYQEKRRQILSEI